ncbi:NAD-dependent epimerase/dehydratase family protein [Ruegeria sp. 2012CJ41-6]|uniref:NAD-dependent epimerase/dehydratase family protein n=1 Tax=Ruegeria spongiae TaxID=2942209 RepID=A0ABT0Q6Y1_9RHOB|nr:NAD-dependent epimerase/dehydratase family protein [Ruegeria spongiae]MCL6285641.1 NAD-dependent epimerase/dehydratase family protein [Ruegeria spongiae]
MTKPLYLVTGAAGFVGRHLVEHLVARGDRVRAMVRKPEQAGDLKGLAEEVVIGDLQKPETLASAVEGVAGIYHIAAVFRVGHLPDEVFHEINAEGVRRMLDAAIAAGVPRFVHCSTNGVHSHIEHPPAAEDYPFSPGDVYQESKLAGELIAMEYFNAGRICGAILRPAMIYGPGDTRMLKLFKMIAKRRFFYIGRGEALVHWLDVRDLAEAFRLAMMAEEVNAEAFLIAGREYMTLAESAREIARQLDVPEPWLRLPVGPMMTLAHATELVCVPLGIDPPLFRRRVAFFLKNRAFNISKAETMLGYAPKQDLAGEIADTIADYRARGDLPPVKTEMTTPGAGDLPRQERHE